MHWARERPQATFLAQRDERGDWRRLSYATALERVQALGISLTDRGLDCDHPLMILSGNTIEHALLTLAALHVGVPVAPLSPAYSLLSPDAANVRHAVELLTPGWVFADHGAAYARPVERAVPVGTEIVIARGGLGDRAHTTFAELEGGAATANRLRRKNGLLRPVRPLMAAPSPSCFSPRAPRGARRQSSIPTACCAATGRC